MSIRTLEPDVVSKIAAGEVVERPASVVKELVENSLDAGATQVAVESRGGGIGSIRVTDNGSGIRADEVELAFRRHATSKISSFDDLHSVSSLGFRGEALPSIAAVAGVEMLTRTEKDAVGTFIRLADGAVGDRGQRGCPRGTTVTVSNLFRNVPARFKFLKSVATESGHISNVVTQYSLAFPEVRFTLLVDGRLTLQTQGNGDMRDVLVRVYGLKVADEMLAVGGEELSVRGFVGSPAVGRSSRGYLSFFVNGRWVRSPLLGRAVEEAYHGLLMTGKHPVAVLRISLPFEDVDVNVHPTKAEVRFRNERDLFTVVERAVRAALVEQMPVPSIRRQPAPVAAPAAFREPPHRPPPARQEMLLDSGSPVSAPGLSSKSTLPILRVLGQLSAMYIIAEGPDGLYLIDQHAAHERVLLERFQAQRARNDVEVQGLLEPLTVEITPRQDELLRHRADLLASYGFVIEPFGPLTYLLRAVPAVVRAEAVSSTIADILDSFAAGGKVDLEERIATSIACHSAVKAGDALTMDEMRNLVRDMEATESPHTCPHGRPTMVRFSSSQLEREFGRVV
ncbi:MAG: DNA mismatch repair endonuclease MutL [Chloroflexota bacterium]|nr:DNA mismatch repair endonuclease MutL [Chloroflexota bacterium]